MKRKLMSLLLVLVMLLSLAACSDTPDATDPPAPSDSNAQVNNPTEEENTPDTQPETVPQVTFEEIVLVDDENCTVKITAIDTENFWGYTLKVFLENKTDLELMYTLDAVSVNGFMCDPFWATTVTAGMKSNEEISFSSDDFELNGIADVTDISFTLKVYDDNDWTADNLVDDTFTIYPLGEEAVQPYTRTPVDGEIVLFDNEDCAMIVTGFDPDNMWGYTMNVYLENKTDKNLMFSIDGAAVNGFMCDPFWADSIVSGKRSNTTISWMESDFEDNGITDVESLTLPIRVYDEDDWMAEDLINETFTVNP